MHTRYFSSLIVTGALVAAVVAQDTAQEKFALALGGEFEFRQTDHWIIAYTADEKQVDQVASALERLHEVFTETFEKIGIDLTEPDKPLEVVLYADKKSYEAHQARRVRPRTIPGNGAYSPRSNRIVLIVPGSRRRSSLINLVVHEGAHQLAFNLGVQDRRESYPPWIGEGLASAFETRDVDNEFGPLSKVRNPRWRNMALRAATGRTMPVRELIVLHRPTTDPEDDSQRSARQDNSAIYNQGASMIVFMMREKPSEFIKYLHELGKLPRFRDPSEMWRDAFVNAFGDPDEFEEEWKEWLSKQERESMDFKL